MNVNITITISDDELLKIQTQTGWSRSKVATEVRRQVKYEGLNLEESRRFGVYTNPETPNVKRIMWSRGW